MSKVPQLKQKQRRNKTNKSLLFLVLVLLIGILIILFLKSSLSKVQEINVMGNLIASEQEIINKSQLRIGVQFFYVHGKKVEQNVEVLPSVKSVNVLKKFPGKINIEITEYDRVAYLLDPSGKLLPVLENGKLLTYHDWKEQFIDRPVIRYGFDLALLPRLSEELSKLDRSILGKISEIVHKPTDTDTYQVYLYMKDGNEVRSSLVDFHKNMTAYEPFVASLKKEGLEQGIITLREGMWYKPYDSTDEEDMETTDNKL